MAMKTLLPYDPEDIESLMLHKSFGDLYPEEREFVLRHVESPDEYESMRNVLLALNRPTDSALENPDSALKDELMSLFAREERKGFSLWLNSVLLSFLGTGQIWYRRPVIQFAVGSVLLGVGIGWIMQSGAQARLAELRPRQNQITSPAGQSVQEPQEATRIPETPKIAESRASEPIVASLSSLTEETQMATQVEASVQASAESLIMEESTNDEAAVTRESGLPGSAEKSADQLAMPPIHRKASDVSASVSLKEVSGLLEALYTAR